ncbi:hypothetical protein AB0B94_30345 [Micromonospora sp. NPDC048986]|uniref:hypothetical protein n=1 Tax=Micromonospora sp. NPDC048986 TaxID=3155644 RepID=UPI0033CAD9DD
MTAVMPPMLRTVDQTRDRRPLPTMTDPAWDDSRTVWDIALYQERTVFPEAHALAHPRPVVDCPFCPPTAGEAPDRSNENYWRQVAS